MALLAQASITTDTVSHIPQHDEVPEISIPTESTETSPSNEGEVVTTHTNLTNTEAIVRNYFADIPVMAEVAFCESTFRQYDSAGQVLRGRVNGSDVGVMQINTYYHGSTAEKLGLDLHTIEGNMAYARYLYDTQGTAPWIHSKHCWSQSQYVAVR